MTANYDADYLDYQRESELLGTPPGICALHNAPKSKCGHLPHRDPRKLIVAKRPARVDAQEELDLVNHPPHYKHVSGIECIEITRQCHCDLGSAIQYIWRYDTKGRPIEDLRKARWYLRDIMASGLSYNPPWKAKSLLLDVINAETDPLRRGLLIFISVGHLDDAIATITEFVGSED